MELLNRLSKYFTQERNQAYTIAGGLGGTFLSFNLLASSANGALIVKYVIGLVMAGLTGLVTKMGADLWTVKLKPVIFSMFKKPKKNDNERRA